MEIEESLFMEESVDSDSHVMTDAEHCTKCIGTWTQVRYLTQELHRVSFLLQWISIVASTKYFYFACLNFTSLTRTYRFNQLTVYAKACACGDEFQHIFVEICQIDYNLHIIYSRTIVQGNKVYLFATTASTNPTFYIDHSSEIAALQQVNNFCSTNCLHCMYLIYELFK